MLFYEIQHCTPHYGEANVKTLTEKTASNFGTRCPKIHLLDRRTAPTYTNKSESLWNHWSADYSVFHNAGSKAASDCTGQAPRSVASLPLFTVLTITVVSMDRIPQITSKLSAHTREGCGMNELSFNKNWSAQEICKWRPVLQNRTNHVLKRCWRNWLPVCMAWFAIFLPLNYSEIKTIPLQNGLIFQHEFTKLPWKNDGDPCRSLESGQQQISTSLHCIIPFSMIQNN